jgi:hypothetical protein
MDAAAAASWTPEPDVRWAPAPPVLPRSAPWALTFAVVGLIVSLVVGWGFLIGIVGAVSPSSHCAARGRAAPSRSGRCA